MKTTDIDAVDAIDLELFLFQQRKPEPCCSLHGTAVGATGQHECVSVLLHCTRSRESALCWFSCLAEMAHGLSLTLNTWGLMSPR
jgi:hypothetical protein